MLVRGSRAAVPGVIGNIHQEISSVPKITPDLSGKIVCVDAFNAIYQFLSSVRQPDGTPLMDSKKRVTSHLSGIFYRNLSLLESGVRLVYVFDGEPPKLKYKTHEKRGEARDVAKGKYDIAKSEEDIEGMRRYSSQFIRLNDEMIDESKDLLMAMGIQVYRLQAKEKQRQLIFQGQKKKSMAVLVRIMTACFSGLQILSGI